MKKTVLLALFFLGLARGESLFAKEGIFPKFHGSVARFKNSYPQDHTLRQLWRSKLDSYIKNGRVVSVVAEKTIRGDFQKIDSKFIFNEATISELQDADSVRVSQDQLGRDQVDWDKLEGHYDATKSFLLYPRVPFHIQVNLVESDRNREIDLLLTDFEDLFERSLVKADISLNKNQEITIKVYALFNLKNGVPAPGFIAKRLTRDEIESTLEALEASL